MFCLYCGNPLPEGAFFCDKCGREQKKDHINFEEEDVLVRKNQADSVYKIKDKIGFVGEEVKKGILKMFKYIIFFICINLFIFLIIAILDIANNSFKYYTSSFAKSLGMQIWSSLEFWIAAFFIQQSVSKVYKLPARFHFWLFVGFYLISAFLKDIYYRNIHFWLSDEIAIVCLMFAFLLKVLLPYTSIGSNKGMIKFSITGYIVIGLTLIFLPIMIFIKYNVLIRYGFVPFIFLTFIVFSTSLLCLTLIELYNKPQNLVSDNAKTDIQC